MSVEGAIFYFFYFKVLFFAFAGGRGHIFNIWGQIYDLRQSEFPQRQKGIPPPLDTAFILLEYLKDATRIPPRFNFDTAWIPLGNCFDMYLFYMASIPLGYRTGAVRYFLEENSNVFQGGHFFLILFFAFANGRRQIFNICGKGFDSRGEGVPQRDRGDHHTTDLSVKNLRTIKSLGIFFFQLIAIRHQPIYSYFDSKSLVNIGVETS